MPNHNWPKNLQTILKSFLGLNLPNLFWCAGPFQHYTLLLLYIIVSQAYKKGINLLQNIFILGLIPEIHFWYIGVSQVNLRYPYLLVVVA